MRNIITGALLACAAIAATPAAAAEPSQPCTTPSTTEAVVRIFFDEVFIQGKIRHGFECYVREDYIQHNPLAADGRDAVLKFFESIPADKLPKVTLARIIAQGDLAAVHYKTEFPGQPPMAVVDIFRVDHGKIAEHWDVVQPIPPTSANPHPMF